MYQLGFSGFFKEIFPIITTLFGKGQLNSECIYEVIVSPKMPTKNFKDFCPTNKLKIFGWHFGKNDDIINTF